MAFLGHFFLKGFFFFFFLMWTIFKVFVELVTILLPFYILVFFVHKECGILLPWWFSGKKSSSNAEDEGSISWLGGSLEEVNGNPLQYSNRPMGNPMDRGAWWDTVHGVE